MEDAFLILKKSDEFPFARSLILQNSHPSRRAGKQSTHVHLTGSFSLQMGSSMLLIICIQTYKLIVSQYASTLQRHPSHGTHLSNLGQWKFMPHSLHPSPCCTEGISSIALLFQLPCNYFIVSHSSNIFSFSLHCVIINLPLFFTSSQLAPPTTNCIMYRLL